MPRETSRSGKGAHRLPQFSNCIPKATNSTPTNSKQSIAAGVPQVFPQEHITWHREDPPKDFSRPQLTLVHYTTRNGPHMSRHPVPHQYFIHTRYLYNQFPDPTNRRGNYGRTKTPDGGR